MPTPIPTPPPAAPAPAQATKASPYRRFAIPIEGTHFYLSEREKLVCEVFLETNGNVSEAARRVNKRFGRNYGSNTIRRWIDRKKLISRYLADQKDKRAEVQAFTEDEWRLMAVQALKGKRAMNAIQVQLWKDWGKFEVHKEGGVSVGNQTNIQIRFGERE